MNPKRCFLLFLLLIAALALAGCPSDDGSDADDQADDDEEQAGPQWSWTLNPDGSISIYSDDRLLFQWIGMDLLRFDPKVSMLFGFFDFEKSQQQILPLVFGLREDEVVLIQSGVEVGSVRFDKTDNGNLRVFAELNSAFEEDALRLHFAKADGDRFWGFGEQYSFIDFAGRSVPVWTQEQGIGRSERPLLPFTGRLTDTYFPMPYFMDPEQGKGFFIENTEYSLFDLGESLPGRWSVETWNGRRASFVLLAGPAPGDVVSQLTMELGRPHRQPPDWAFSGVWLAAQGGTDAVRERVRVATDAGIPISAVWVQDWVGVRYFGLGNYGVKYRWNHDPEHYPGLEGFIAELGGSGIRFLGYFNPFVVPQYEQYDQGKVEGYLIRRANGDPYVFLISTFFGSLLDVTNPDAVDWFQGYARDAIDLGMSGWMADFGEWLPFDAHIEKGPASAVHNTYPTDWHRVNRAVLAEAFPERDFVLLTRSGFNGEHQVAQIVWAGDQEASWSETDGLPTVVTAGLTIGLSGIPFFTHDIAGFSGGPSTKELFLRWTELGAFTPVMRTHDGLQKQSNHRFDSDEETLSHFTRFALVHQALLPYFKVLAGEAVDRGLPMIRHTVLVDPDWEDSVKAGAQWMLGEDLLLAPVVKRGAQEVTVYFPDGEWEHVFTAERYPGRSVATVAAPIGAPAAFVRAGRLDAIVREIRDAASAK